jgi:DNA-binding transcriptional ArsR family regulator
MREFLNITGALADETRVRLLLALRGGELCVCQLAALSGLAMSTVSKHLSLLYQARLVTSRKQGRWIFYALPGKEAPAAAREGLAWAMKHLALDPRIREDARELKRLLQIDPAELCKTQCGN